MSKIENELEFHSLKYGQKTLNFCLKYSNRNTLGISVSPSCLIEVVAPDETKFEKIIEGVENRASWILKQIEYFSSFEKDDSLKCYKSGSNVKYSGRDYVLSVVQVESFQEEFVEVSGEHILLFIHDRTNQERINLFVEEWLRNEALIKISQCVEENFQKLKKYGVERPKYYLRKMKLRWGSCTPEGIIYFNPELVTLSKTLINYVVIHELCHLKYQNHSKDFYSLVETVLPEWKELDNYINFSI
jgi:predicted metal-dependent hydrolase